MRGNTHIYKSNVLVRSKLEGCHIYIIVGDNDIVRLNDVR